ncbi:MAG: phage portal protein [Acidimicrobiia bacterium]
MPIVRGFLSSIRGHQGPSPGSMRGSSHLGNISLIGSRGVSRSATYRAIYRTNPWVWAAVSKLSRDMARLPLHVFELGEKGRRSRVRGDLPNTAGPRRAGELLDLLARRPDPKLSRYAYWRGTMVDQLVYGNALSKIERDSGLPRALARRRWRDVTHVEERAGDVVYYEMVPGGIIGGRPERLVPGDVVHFGRGIDSEDPVAPSPLEACRFTLALYEGVIRHLVAFFENQMRPSGHIKVDKLTKEVEERIRRVTAELYASPENAGKVLVTSGEWQAVSESMEHASVVELIRLSREEIAAVYGVPPPVIGILEQAIKSNVKELREEYVREGLGPWANQVEDDLAAQLISPVPAWKALFAEFQLAERLRPDMEARSLIFSRLRNVFSPDEFRALENMEPLDIPGISDVPWVDSGSQPLSAFAPGKLAEDVAGAVARILAGHPNGDGGRKIPEEIS